MDTPSSTNDHDLLIEVNANVKNLTATLQSYTSTVSTQMTDHENRLRDLEKAEAEHAGALKTQKVNMQIMGLVFTVISIGIAILAIVWK